MELSKPILCISYTEEKKLESFLSSLNVEHITEPFFFPHIQKYYSKEMGENIFKVYASLRGLINGKNLVDFKLWAINQEAIFSQDRKRRLNIDPGYVDESHLVLTSSKKRGGRLYLGRGVYAEMEYLFVHGGFRALYWTYADYRDRKVKGFFEMVRRGFLDELKAAKCGDKLWLVSFSEHEFYETLQAW
ncbi:MAG: DUF4416 family protein [Aquificaceae bacterium]